MHRESAACNLARVGVEIFGLSFSRDNNFVGNHEVRLVDTLSSVEVVTGFSDGYAEIFETCMLPWHKPISLGKTTVVALNDLSLHSVLSYPTTHIIP